MNFSGHPRNVSQIKCQPSRFSCVTSGRSLHLTLSLCSMEVTPARVGIGMAGGERSTWNSRSRDSLHERKGSGPPKIFMDTSDSPLLSSQSTGQEGP